MRRRRDLRDPSPLAVCVGLVLAFLYVWLASWALSSLLGVSGVAG